MSRTPTAVVFDLGGVLLDWNPRHLYRTRFAGDEAAMERFLAEVCTQEWNEEQDAGRPWSEAVALLQGQHPGWAEHIAAYDLEWEQMLAGVFEPNVALLARLRQMGVPVYALSNFSAEKFPLAQRRFEFLQWFDGTVISGTVKMKKPDPRIFFHLAETYRLTPAEAVFIDDSPKNVEAAAGLGFHAIRYESPAQLVSALAGLGFAVTDR